MSSTNFTIYTPGRVDHCPPNPPYVITSLNALYLTDAMRPDILTSVLDPEAHDPTFYPLRTFLAVATFVVMRLMSCSVPPPRLQPPAPFGLGLPLARPALLAHFDSLGSSFGLPACPPTIAPQLGVCHLVGA
ncbi:unnamed protein product [Linum trigynum]|uniref:Uncharacterized protein n=1 Tax=Linum trigynum TaxID=586398 RepID=A0AAV2D8T3_9ROSI